MTISGDGSRCFYAIGVLAAGQLGVVPPLVPALQRELGLSLAAAELSVSTITLVGALLGLPAGDWSERVGHARALRIGILIMAVAAALSSGRRRRDDAARGARVGRPRLSAGCCCQPLPDRRYRRAAASARSRSSLWGTFVPAGIAISGIATAAFADRTGWRLIFAIDVILLAVALIVAVVALPQTHVPQRDAAALVDRQTLLAAAPLRVAFFCFALVFLALAGLLPAWLVGSRGLAATEAGRLAIATVVLRNPREQPPGGLADASRSLSRAAGGGRSDRLHGDCALSFGAATPVPLAIAGFAVSFALCGCAGGSVRLGVPQVAGDQRAIGPINGLLARAWQPRIFGRSADARALGRRAGLVAGAGDAVRRRRDRCGARARSQARLDALLHHQQPRLAGDRQQAAVRSRRDRGSSSRCSSRCRRSPGGSRRARR